MKIHLSIVLDDVITSLHKRFNLALDRQSEELVVVGDLLFRAIDKRVMIENHNQAKKEWSEEEKRLQEQQKRIEDAWKGR